MNFKTLCEKICKREDAKKGDVNITQVRTVMRHFFEMCVDMQFANAELFFERYFNYYKNKSREKGGK